MVYNNLPPPKNHKNTGHYEPIMHNAGIGAQRRGNLPNTTWDVEQRDVGYYISTSKQIATGFAHFIRRIPRNAWGVVGVLNTAHCSLRIDRVVD